MAYGYRYIPLCVNFLRKKSLPHKVKAIDKVEIRHYKSENRQRSKKQAHRGISDDVLRGPGGLGSVALGLLERFANAKLTSKARQEIYWSHK